MTRVYWLSDVVERPCDQLPPVEQAVSSEAGDKTLHSPGDGDTVAPDYDPLSSDQQIFNDKYISDRDLTDRHRTNSDNTAVRTAAYIAHVLYFASFITVHAATF